MASPSASGVPHTRSEPLSKLDEIRDKVENSLFQFRTLLKAIRAPLPTKTGDGSQLPVQEKKSVAKDVESLWRDLNKLGIQRIEDLVTVGVKMKNHEPLDDKKYLMERLIQAAAILPDDKLSKKLTGDFLTQLWRDLDHPPPSLLNEESMFRHPDGSNNSYQLPKIGAAGMPYARTVAPRTMLDGELPEPGVLFDTVLARKNAKGTDHPNKISSMLFYLASIIIHDVFKTNRDDYRISDTSSYLDLAPLYGSNWTEQKRMRTFSDGKLKPDCFSETRLLTFPPGVGAILIMFNRYHNYVADNLALINENGRFTENPKKRNVQRYGESINKRDDDLFQTARLVTCGLYINIILIDYVRTILNLNRTDSNWQLNPRLVIPDGPPLGVGNQVSAEFNLVYRWHSSVSTRDEAWTEQLYKESIEPLVGMPPAEAAKPENLYKFLGVLAQIDGKSAMTEPEKRPFPAMKGERMERIPDGPLKGHFKDEDLAKILTESIEDCANAMGPQQVPPILKAVEILGIKQSRTWQVATLNEFRKHFALEPHQEFSDITDNVEVQETLKHLYGTPDSVELYPGLVLEDAKRPMLPGSGLCPSYTVSRGVLSDAVALVRGDRYYTTSYTPAALTNWGYQEASSDVATDNGCVWYKLFLRALPDSYHHASVYIHYPMTVPYGPDGMQDVLERLGKSHKYNFEPPKPVRKPTVLFSYDAAKRVIDDSTTFKVDFSRRALIQKSILSAAPTRTFPNPSEKWVVAVRSFYEQTTAQLLSERGYNLGSFKQVDIIRDVGNIVQVRFAAELFGLPMKTEKFPYGVFTEQQLYLILVSLFTAMFFDVDPAKSFSLRQQSVEVIQLLGTIMQWLVSAVKATENLPFDADKVIGMAMPASAPLREFGGVNMISHLLQNHSDTQDVVWGHILPACGAIPVLGQYFALALDYLLNTAEGRTHLPEINRLAKLDNSDADDAILHYFLEAARLGSEIGAVRDVDKDVTITDAIEPLPTRTLHLKKGDRVLVNLNSAQMDPKAFPNPNAFDLQRPVESYIFLTEGPHQLLGKPIALVALPTMLKVVARLDGLRSATVSVGGKSVPSSVKKVVKELRPGDADSLPEEWQFHTFLTEAWDVMFPFPTNLKINWNHSTNPPSGAQKHLANGGNKW